MIYGVFKALLIFQPLIAILLKCQKYRKSKTKNLQVCVNVTSYLSTTTERRCHAVDCMLLPLLINSPGHELKVS